MTTILEQFQALSASAQYSVSEYFMDQLRSFPQNPAFFVKAADLKARLFEIVLTNPVLVTEPDNTQTVQVKAQLNHLVLPQGEGNSFKLVNTPKSKTNRNGQFNKGHYTPTLNMGQQLVSAGLLTKHDIEALVNYCGTWEANGDQNYTAGSAAAKQRLWLNPRSIQGYITFVMTERTSPEGDAVPAIEQLAWTPGDFSIIGVGVTENAQDVRTAPALAMDSMVPAGAPSVAAPVGRSLV